MSRLLELPSELLEHSICQYLDLWTISQLSLVNHRVQHDLRFCSELWEILVTRHFGYVNKPPLIRQPRSNSDNRDKVEIDWKAVFAAAWRDSVALASATQKEYDVLHVYNQKSYPMLLQPREIQIRREIVLMQGLRRIPTNQKLIQLYAEVIRQAHLVPRMNAASTARALRRHISLSWRHNSPKC